MIGLFAKRNRLPVGLICLAVSVMLFRNNRKWKALAGDEEEDTVPVVRPAAPLPAKPPEPVATESAPQRRAGDEVSATPEERPPEID